MTTRRAALRRGGTLGLVIGLALAACTGDGDSGDASITIAAGSPAVTQAPDTTAPDSTPAGETTNVAAEPSDLPPCPDAAVVGTAIGVEMVVEPNPPKSAPGFCPYTAADGGGSIIAAVTFTHLDLTQDPGAAPSEPVDGLGVRATWSTIGELTVWTGDVSLYITVSVLGPGHGDIDDRAASIAFAEAILDTAG